jgi:hypothetical protein
MISLMMVLCLATLSRQPFHYRAARATLGLAQARSLAELGLQQFRAKWNHDGEFPPRPSAGSPSFSYSEEVLDPISSERVGSYQITVTDTWMDPPYEILKVISEGQLGPANNPVASYRIEALLDLSVEPRLSRPVTTGQWIEWRELPMP